jgi:small-conductance mechanosensitive channel
MDYVTETLRADWQAFLAFSPRLLYAALLLGGFWVAGGLSGRLVARVLERSQRLRPNTRFVRRITNWTLRVAGLLLALGVMGFQGVAASLLATGGVLAIVLGFAFREIGENLLAGLFLTFSRPFEIGDLVRTGDLTGTVRAIDIRSTHLRTADACDVFVPNAEIFREKLYNYTRDGLRRPGFTVGVAYHDEPEKVLQLLESAARNVPEVLAEPAAFACVKEFADSHIVYEVFFWMDTRNSKRSVDALATDVKVGCWRALSEAGMTFSTDVSTSLDIRSVPPLRIGEDTA